MTTLTTPVGPFTPAAVETYAQERESTNQVHDLVGGGVDVTFGPTRLRRGRFRALFLTGVMADAARAAHAYPGTFALTDNTAPTVSMSYIPVGRVTVETDDTLAGAWWVKVEFAEVPA